MLKTKNQEARNPARRSFLRYGGATLATASLVMTGCEEFYDLFPREPITGVQLGKGDTGILNYAYTLEQLEARFYTLVVATADQCGFSDEEQQILSDLQKHEVIHQDFFKAALGKDAIAELMFDFSSVDFTSRSSVLKAAKTFEDLGVAAYNGAGQLLESADLLLVAGKIVSVEARHAAAIRSILDGDPTSFAGDDVIDANGLDRAFMPSMVLNAASDFIVTPIDASELPTA
ncbi:MAG: ferritin-like domain-containing protein [Tunicatimonas sp.]